MQVGSDRPVALSKLLFRIWLGTTAGSVLIAALFLLIPNELIEHVGFTRVFTYALSFVLAVAIVTLPLPIAAAIVDARARRNARAQK